MLAGFRSIDEHFRTAPFERNLPVLLGLIGIWYDDFFGAETQAILPVQPVPRRASPRTCSSSTWRATASRSTSRATRSRMQTGPIVWGQPGTNGQHAFYQLIHQGTKLIPADFIGFVHANHEVGDHQDLLMANCSRRPRRSRSARRAQVEAEGVPEPGAAPHFAGNHPTNTILAERLTPYTLGQLVAIYEHKVFTQGTIWNINSFDQWGVELGKTARHARSSPSSTAAAEPEPRPRQQHQRAHPPLPPRSGGGP